MGPPEAAFTCARRLMRQANDLSLEGRVVAIAADPRHHFSKQVQDSIVLVEDHGIAGDAPAGPFVRHRYLARRRPRLPNLRQVHLIPFELFASLLDAGFEVGPGGLGENITTGGLELERMPLGALLQLGTTAVIELTGPRTPCVPIDRFRAGLKRNVIWPSVQMRSAGSGSGRRGRVTRGYGTRSAPHVASRFASSVDGPSNDRPQLRSLIANVLKAKGVHMPSNSREAFCLLARAISGKLDLGLTTSSDA